MAEQFDKIIDRKYDANEKKAGLRNVGLILDTKWFSSIHLMIIQIL